MKRVLAIGDVDDDSDDDAGDGSSDDSSSSSARTVDPGPVKVRVQTNDVLQPSAAGTAARKPAGPAVWVQQSDGSWAIRWRVNDTWWDLSARYLQDGKRWRELFNFQSDAFHARVKTPVAIYTTAIVAMPDEAVQRAKLLGDLPGGGAQPAPTPAPTPKQTPVNPVRPNPSPAGALPSSAPSASDGGQLHWWLLGGLGVASVSAIGVVAYRAQRASQGRRGS